MQIFHHYSSLSLDECTVVGIGNFDGLHQGHLALVKSVQESAKTNNLQSAILTFHPHPMRFFRGKNGPQAIYSIDDRLSLLNTLGIELTLAQEFDLNFAQLSPFEFVEHVLIRALKAKVIVVGYDFAFGHKRSGRVQDLQAFAAQWDVEVHVIEAQSWDPNSNPHSSSSPPDFDQSLFEVKPVFSSTWIRSLLNQGHVELATHALSRPYHVRGEVSHGHKRGRTLGFPTANLALSSEICPQPGVYSGWLDWGKGGHPAVISVGTNPTFQTPHLLHHEQEWSVEVHVLNQTHSSLDLYGKSTCLWFEHFLRSPIQFSHLNQLVEQIKIDCNQAQSILSSLNAPSWPVLLL